MASGGARPGAGRKPGGANRANQEALERAKEGGELPLDYLLRVMRDEASDAAKRIDCAKAAAPYVHPKRAPVDGDGNDASLTLNIVTGVPRADGD
jgi:hypothetical protein